jgi:hypothetical protein
VASVPIETTHATDDWNEEAAFITVECARVSAEGMSRNFGTEASRVCAEMAAKWIARDDPHAQKVWRTIQQLVDRNTVSGDRRREGYMSTFRIIRIPNAKGETGDGWAVQRCDPGGQAILVTRRLETEQEAANEAARLTRETARGTLT